jgi:hypothetical protein
MSTALFDAVAEQRLAALEKANASRAANAQMIRDLSVLDTTAQRVWLAGRLVDDEFVSGPAGALTIGRMLRQIRHLGITKISRCISRAGILTYDRQLRQLTSRQRRLIAEFLRGEETEA